MSKQFIEVVTGIENEYLNERNPKTSQSSIVNTISVFLFCIIDPPLEYIEIRRKIAMADYENLQQKGAIKKCCADAWMNTIDVLHSLVKNTYLSAKTCDAAPLQPVQPVRDSKKCFVDCPSSQYHLSEHRRGSHGLLLGT